MKILYFSVIEQNAGWGAETFINRGFKKLGAQTTCIDYRKYRNKLTGKLLEENINDYDILFLQRGEGFPMPILKAFKGPRVFWCTELVSRRRDADRLLKSGLFDHIYVHTEECKRIIVKRGWERADKISVVLNGFDEEVQKPVKGCEQDIDILFVGKPMERRQRIVRELQKEFSVLETKAFGHDMALLFNRAKIVLNLHSEEYPDTETRVFEALGCGSFLLSEKLSKDSPFMDGVHLVEAEDLSGLKKRAAYYLDHEVDRKKIALTGYNEAVKSHTYTKRAGDFINLFSSIRKNYNKTYLDISCVRKYAGLERFEYIYASVIGFLKRILRGNK
ncbi:MAG: glycosyltransferase [Spirochaetales bacterium]|nr:glycosyltransferase [Spirochaetales bacterium]